jgi:hypothetical protein
LKETSPPSSSNQASAAASTLLSLVTVPTSVAAAASTILYRQLYSAEVGGPVGLSPPLFFILAGKSKFEEQRKRGKNYQKTDGPRTDDTTISASTNKMRLVRFYSPAIKLQRQNI